MSISFLLNKFWPRKINFKFLKFFNAEKISGEEILFLNRYNFSNLGNSNFLNISIQSLPKLLSWNPRFVKFFKEQVNKEEISLNCMFISDKNFKLFKFLSLNINYFFINFNYLI